MASTLPQISSECCPPACTEVTSVQVPGPAGTDGADGADGVDGQNAYTTFTVAFTIPAEGASAVATVANSDWIGVNQILYASKSDGSVVAYLQATAIGGSTSVTLKNIEDTPSSAYTPNSAPGSIFTIGSKLSAGGLQGPGTTASGAAGGDLKGTYPNPKISVANTKGSSLWGNGTDTVAVGAGTNGHMLAYDSTDAEGVKSFKALPLTGDTDLADNRVMRADGATGLPVPAQPSKVTITDNGAIRADGSGGNARGTDAIDLQVSRAGATQVASGTNSTIGGGQSNTASNTSSTVGGGDSNQATGINSVVGGGSSNGATALGAAVAGGTGNVASDTAAFIGGGESNVANTNDSTVCGGTTNVAGDGGTHNRAFVGGGAFNNATGLESVVSGGSTNTASGPNSTVSGGENNIASGADSFVGGGDGNTASAAYSSAIAGLNATSDKHGQVSHSAGMFAAAGDCQTSHLQWRISTIDATANVEAFLDGAAVRATIPSGKSWVFSILHIGRSSAGVTAAWKTEGAIQNNAGTTALVAAVTNTLIADGTGGTWGAAGNVPVVDADNANDTLRIRVTGAAVTTIRWTSIARIAELGH